MWIEYRVNTRSNYGEIYCNTCDKTIGMEDAGLAKLAPAQINLLYTFIAEHRQNEIGHSVKFVVANRMPTNDELRRGLSKKRLNHIHNLSPLSASQLRKHLVKKS